MELTPFGLNQKTINPQFQDVKPLKESRVEWGEYGVLAGSIMMAVGAILSAHYALHSNNHYIFATYYNIKRMAITTLTVTIVGCAISAISALIIRWNNNKKRERCEKATTQTELVTTLKGNSLLLKRLIYIKDQDRSTRGIYFGIATIMTIYTLCTVFVMSMSQGSFYLSDPFFKGLQISAKVALYSTIPLTIAMAVNTYYLVSKQKQRHQKLSDAEIQQLLNREAEHREEAHNQAHRLITEVHDL